jgi:hypothetical protein
LCGGSLNISDTAFPYQPIAFPPSKDDVTTIQTTFLFPSKTKLPFPCGKESRQSRADWTAKERERADGAEIVVSIQDLQHKVRAFALYRQAFTFGFCFTTQMRLHYTNGKHYQDKPYLRISSDLAKEYIFAHCVTLYFL